MKEAYGRFSRRYVNASRSFDLIARLAFSAVLAMVLSMFFCEQAIAAQSEEIAGDNRYETAAKQAREAYPEGCGIVIVTGSEAWADALSATGLAGVLDCPILFVEPSYVPVETAEAVKDLGASELIIIGGQSAVSDDVEANLASAEGVASVKRVCGANRVETQMAIYEFGRSGYDGVDHWNHDLAIVATSSSFPDALSVSPLAVAEGAPVFLVDSNGLLSEEQDLALLTGEFKRAVVVGGSSAVADQTFGYLKATTAFFSDGEPNAVRLGGSNRYETSSLVAHWCVSEGYLSWNGAAFASGTKPYDALAGSVLQGGKGSVLLLVGDATSATIDALAKQRDSIDDYVYFGGTGVTPEPLRTYIAYSIEMGCALGMGRVPIADGSYVHCDPSGVVTEERLLYRSYIDKANGYSSVTGWLILVDDANCRTIVFSGSQGSWVVEKVYECTVGAWSSPTKKGVFTVGLRGLSFGSGYTCWYWTQFSGNYLFHSVLYNPGSMTSIQDGRLGIHASHGCVRLDINDAKWIYDNIPTHSKVVVY